MERAALPALYSPHLVLIESQLPADTSALLQLPDDQARHARARTDFRAAGAA